MEEFKKVDEVKWFKLIDFCIVIEIEEKIFLSFVVYCVKNIYFGLLVNLWLFENNLLLKYCFIDIFVLCLFVYVFFLFGKWIGNVCFLEWMIFVGVFFFVGVI